MSSSFKLRKKVIHNLYYKLLNSFYISNLLNKSEINSIYSKKRNQLITTYGFFFIYNANYKTLLYILILKNGSKTFKLNIEL